MAGSQSGGRRHSQVQTRPTGQHPGIKAVLLPLKEQQRGQGTQQQWLCAGDKLRLSKTHRPLSKVAIKWPKTWVYYILLTYLPVCLFVMMLGARNMYGGQKTTFQGQISHSSLWIPEMEVRLSAWHREPLPIELPHHRF